MTSKGDYVIDNDNLINDCNLLPFSFCLGSVGLSVALWMPRIPHLSFSPLLMLQSHLERRDWIPLP